MYLNSHNSCLHVSDSQSKSDTHRLKPKVELYLRLRDSHNNLGQNSPRSKPESRISRTGESKREVQKHSPGLNTPAKGQKQKTGQKRRKENTNNAQYATVDVGNTSQLTKLKPGLLYYLTDDM